LFDGDINLKVDVNLMKYIYFSLPIDEDTNMVLQMTIEEYNKRRDDSFSIHVTMEQLIEFRDLLDEVIEDVDRSSWL
jgi:hypothetical protein